MSRFVICLSVFAMQLIAGGAVAFILGGAGGSAKTALFFTIGPAVVLLACAAAAPLIHRMRALGMVAIHAGLGLPLLLAVAYAGRAAMLAGTPDADAKKYLAACLWMLAVMSLGAFVCLLAQRPKPTPKAAAARTGRADAVTSTP